MIERLYNDLKEIFKDNPSRLKHIIGVKDTALKLAQTYPDVDKDKLTIAAYLHDITKSKSQSYHKTMITKHFSLELLDAYSPPLYHAFSAAAYAKEVYGIEDASILDAIKHHTVGRPAMPILEKILFISDYIEPNRPYKACKEVRDIAFKDIDLAVYHAINNAINLFSEHPHTIPKIAYAARDYYQVSSGQPLAYETDRLAFYFAQKKHAPIFQGWWNDGDLMSSVGFEDGLNITLKKVEQNIERSLSDPEVPTLMIVYDKESQKPLGEASFGEFVPKDKSMRIGLKIGDLTQQNKGYGKELTRGLCRYIQKAYHIDTIYIDTLLDNQRAQKLYESLGAETITIKRRFWKDPKGKWRDAIFYRLKGDVHEKT